MSGPDGTAPEDEDAVWRRLVAAFDSDVDGHEPPWPAAEDVASDDTDDTPVSPSDVPQPRIGRVLRFAEPARTEPDPQRTRDGADTPDPPDPGDIYYGAVELEGGGEDHYEAPPPPPLPELDALSKISWVGLLGGPLYLIIAFGLNWTVPGWASAFAVIAALAGFVSLIAHMKDHDPDDPDGGAVV
jgi:hypothetical protein